MYFILIPALQVNPMLLRKQLNISGSNLFPCVMIVNNNVFCAAVVDFVFQVCDGGLAVCEYGEEFDVEIVPKLVE